MNDQDPFRLDGKVALVTGASRGIGAAIALALADAGRHRPGGTAPSRTQRGCRSDPRPTTGSARPAAGLVRVRATTTSSRSSSCSRPAIR
jgi:NAD(P)-dependent dehydrogenase (short-subunit alcohol dehydrogenase family)